ncbi:MAG: RNA polymerase sigma-70 factor [Tannerellaceae bacterium]|nr:RNA polymerase sigma-70 factor [Tannerellaceae bacterium]
MPEKNFDIRTFNKLFAENQKRFIYFAMSYIKDEAAAEDIAMESFLYYWENRELLDSDDNIPAYILKVIKHKCLNYMRAENIRLNAGKEINEHALRVLQTRIFTLEACDPQDLYTEEVKRLVNEGLDALPSQTREIFLLSRYENKSYKEIAAELGISIKTVEFHIPKALKILRHNLKDYFLLFLFVLNQLSNH